MDAPANPSPWPVRRERQRHAAVVAMQKMEAWFEHLDARLSDISNQLCEAPPGLLLSTIEAVGARVSYLEALSVCLPNAEVDHVLCEVMSRQGEVKTASTEGSADAQPELEMSPQKPLVFNIALDNAEDPPEVEDQSLRRSAPGTRRISTLELKQVPETPIDFDEWSERSTDEGLRPVASPDPDVQLNDLRGAEGSVQRVFDGDLAVSAHLGVGGFNGISNAHAQDSDVNDAQPPSGSTERHIPVIQLQTVCVGRSLPSTTTTPSDADYPRGSVDDGHTEDHFGCAGGVLALERCAQQFAEELLADAKAALLPMNVPARILRDPRKHKHWRQWMAIRGGPCEPSRAQIEIIEGFLRTATREQKAFIEESWGWDVEMGDFSANHLLELLACADLQNMLQWISFGGPPDWADGV